MSYYEILLFLHIFGAIVWVGGGILLLILEPRLSRARDYATLEGLFRQASFLSMKVFTPAGLAVLILGILLTIEGPWSFGQLWIVLGLAGFAATFVTGFFHLRPTSDAIAAMIERDGGMNAESAAAMHRLFRHMRLDYAVLALVVADMALKPTRDDVWTLLAMAAVLVLVAALTLRGGETPAPVAETP